MAEQTDPRLRIIDLRNRVLAGETLPKEEIAEALKLLADSRRSATTSARTKREKKAGEPLPENLGDLFAK